VRRVISCDCVAQGERTSNEDLAKLPSETRGEVAEGLVRAALSAVPFVGGPAAELIGLVLEPAIRRRRDKWLTELGEAVSQLRDHSVNFAELADNEAFVTIVLNATAAAARTHEEDKLRALRNAVARAALALGPDEHTEMMFIRFIDEFTALHLQLLAYLRDPGGWFQKHGLQRTDHYVGARSTVLETAFPALRGRAAFYGQIVRELSARGLAQDSLTGMVTAQGMWDPLTTDQGNSFLDYISDPPRQVIGGD
jgi:hypothetical protein